MVRQNLTTNGIYAAAIATPSASGCFFQSRTTAGAATTMTGYAPVNYPYTWLRLQRVGVSFAGYGSLDGANWSLLGSAVMAMSDPVYIGFAVASRTNNATTTAQFRDFDNVGGGASVGSFAAPVEALGPSSSRTGLVLSEIM